MAVVAAILAWAARMVLAPQEGELDTKNRSPLDAYETACLAAGPARAVQAAFAAMVQAGRDVEKIVLAKAVKLMLEERVFLHGNRTVVFE